MIGSQMIRKRQMSGIPAADFWPSKQALTVLIGGSVLLVVEGTAQQTSRRPPTKTKFAALKPYLYIPPGIPLGEELFLLMWIPGRAALPLANITPLRRER
jgi:membrane protease YdiL (CAAX protease family)